MKKQQILGRSALCLIIILSSSALISQEGKLVFEKVYSSGLENNILGDSPERDVTIYLPPDYDNNPERLYPVVYLLHGYSGSNMSWAGQGYLGERFNIKDIADSLIINNLIEPMILVGPDSRNKYKGSFYINSIVTGNWEDFIVKDLIDYIDRNYRTLSKTSGRGIAGHSMGGYGTIELAMKYPDKFGYAYALSACCLDFKEIYLHTFKDSIMKVLHISDPTEFNNLHWLTQAAIGQAAAAAPNPLNPPFFADFPFDIKGNIKNEVWERWLFHDPLTQINSYKSKLESIFELRIECGTSDDLITVNRTFSKALRDEGIKHVYEEYEGDHVNKIRQRFISNVLPFFSENLN